jgi:hypothetical protein
MNQKAIRKKRKKKKRIILYSLVVIAAICGFRSLTADLTAKTWGSTVQDLTAPVARTDSEIKNELQTLAKQDKDYQYIYEHYGEYPTALLAALCNNAEMLSFVRDYPDAEPTATGGFTRKEKKAAFPLLLQWDKRWGYALYGDSNLAISGCAPTCLSMVVLALTKDADATPDQIAAFSEENGYYQSGIGTSWSLMTEGAAHFGVCGTELSLDENVITKHLSSGEPIICSMRPGDFTTSGHFIVLTGEADGKITVCDPNSRQRSEALWDYETLAPQIKNLWAYTAM